MHLAAASFPKAVGVAVCESSTYHSSVIPGQFICTAVSTTGQHISILDPVSVTTIVSLDGRPSLLLGLQTASLALAAGSTRFVLFLLLNTHNVARRTALPSGIRNLILYTFLASGDGVLCAR